MNFTEKWHALGVRTILERMNEISMRTVGRPMSIRLSLKTLSARDLIWQWRRLQKATCDDSIQLNPQHIWEWYVYIKDIHFHNTLYISFNFSNICWFAVRRMSTAHQNVSIDFRCATHKIDRFIEIVKWSTYLAVECEHACPRARASSHPTRSNTC